MPALSDFRVERADHDKTPGIVTEAIIEKIIEADLVVADLSGVNPNVMYELAVRHALGEPFVQMMEAGGDLPFDISSVNTVFFRADLKGRQTAIDNLREAAEAALGEADLGNPIRRAADFRSLRAKGEPDTALVVELLQDLQQEVNQLRRRVADRPGSQFNDQFEVPLSSEPINTIGGSTVSSSTSTVGSGLARLLSASSELNLPSEEVSCIDCGRTLPQNDAYMSTIQPSSDGTSAEIGYQCPSCRSEARREST